jgi:HupE / UreJ protein
MGKNKLMSMLHHLLRRILMILFILAGCVKGVFAHEVRPAYLELHQTGAETFDLLWKIPANGNLRLGLYVKLPAGCANQTIPRGSMYNNAYSERWTIQCPGGLSGKTIYIDGLNATVIDVLVRVEYSDGSTQVERLKASNPSFVVATPVGSMGVARTYTVLGTEHILMGIDHLLFVLALIIITGGGWKLVKTVTAFTISHSITLTLATLGYVHIPQRPVEAIIALSIVFVAAEIIRGRNGKPGITASAPWIVAFLFGLMHGLGFASGLRDAGLPVAHIPTALLFFSIGVELGHFLFIGFVLLVFAAMLRVVSILKVNNQYKSKRIQLLLPYVIGSVAMFWVIQRVVVF